MPFFCDVRKPCNFAARKFGSYPDTSIIIIIISCCFLDEKIEMPQCKLFSDIDLEPVFSVVVFRLAAFK